MNLQYTALLLHAHNYVISFVMFCILREWSCSCVHVLLPFPQHTRLGQYGWVCVYIHNYSCIAAAAMSSFLFVWDKLFPLN